MKSSVKGWLSFGIFIVAILVVGLNLMLNRYLNMGLLILAVSAVLVTVLLSVGDGGNEITVGSIEDD